MEQQQFNLTKLLKALWRFNWIIVVITLVAGGTAWQFTSMQPTVYEATATVMVEGVQTKMSASPAGLATGLEFAYMQDIGSQIQVMKSRSVLERAITQLEPTKATDPQYLQLEIINLRTALKIQQVGGTNLMALTVTSSDPISAQKQANAVAEAYVYEANTSKLTAIKTALTNTTKQLKELTIGKIDLSINPSLNLAITQIDATLVALKAASELLQPKVTKKVVALPGKPASAAANAGTTLTEFQVSTIRQQLKDATAEANEISALVELKLQPAVTGFAVPGADIALIESRTRALTTKLDSLSAEVETIRRAEIDPQVHDELFAVEDMVQVASATGVAVLTQMENLYSVQGQFRQATSANSQGNTVQTMAQYEATRANLQDLVGRIAQHTATLATTLQEAYQQIQKVVSRASTSPSQLDMLLQAMSERVASATTTLQAISQQLHPSPSAVGILLTYPELTVMEIRARAVSTTLNPLLSDLQVMLSDKLDPQVYSELLGIREGIRAANDAASKLPDTIAYLTKGGGGSLSYTALDNLRQQLQLALLTSDSGGARVVDTAVVSSPATGLFQRLRSVILAVVAALLLVIFSVLMLQYFDHTVRDVPQVTSYTGLPLLVRIGKLKTNGNPQSHSILSGSPSHYLEAFRMLRTRLRLDSPHRGVLLVSSPGENEGKTTVAANLARAVALQGYKVLLIDGDLRKPHVAAAFGLGEVKGLSELLIGENELCDYIKKADGIDVLPAGAASAGSAEILSSPRMKEVLEKARQTYDVVIVDSAPIIGCTDARILAKDVDEVVLVIRYGASKLELVRDSKQALETLGVRVVGFVLNGVDPKECNYLPYHYRSLKKAQEQHG